MSPSFFPTVNLRIHTIDKKCCRLHVKLSSTSRDILTESCSKLELDVSSYELCEIKSTGEKIIFKETDLSIATEMSVNGRLYALPKDSEAAIVSFSVISNQYRVILDQYHVVSSLVRVLYLIRIKNRPLHFPRVKAPEKLLLISRHTIGIFSQTFSRWS